MQPKPSKDTYVHGYHLYYDDEARLGLEHLKDDLQRDEAKVFFEYARQNRKEAQFEDDDDRQFSIFYNGDSTYTLKKR
jgi:hypothetical protein